MPNYPYMPEPVNNRGTLPVELSAEGLTLTDEHGVIMAWSMQELQVPYILSIAINSANLYIEQDASTVRSSLGLTENQTTEPLQNY